MYALTNHKLYIMQKANNSITTANIDEAILYTTKEKADNALKNLPRAFRNIGFVVKEVEPEENDVVQWNYDEFIDQHCLDNVDEKISNLQKFLRNVYAQKTFAEQQLQNIEKEITDIEHAAEFYNLNAANGYKLYKMLHEARNKRRKYKDQLLIIDIIMDGNIGDISNGRTLRRIKGLDNRKYKPRILEELFEMEKV